jgi:hypothetical protein
MFNVKTHTIELTDEQRNNLIAFLNRTQMKGEEVPAFLEIMQALKKEDKNVKDK